MDMCDPGAFLKEEGGWWMVDGGKREESVE